MLSHTLLLRPWNHHSVITAIIGDDGVLMSILMSATSSGSQLADNYDRPQYYHNDGSISTVKNHHWMLKVVYISKCLLSEKHLNWMLTLITFTLEAFTVALCRVRMRCGQFFGSYVPVSVWGKSLKWPFSRGKRFHRLLRSSKHWLSSIGHGKMWQFHMEMSDNCLMFGSIASFILTDRRGDDEKALTPACSTVSKM